MTGTPRSQKLCSLLSTAGPANTAFTCPPDHVVLLKSFWAYNGGSVAAVAQAALGTAPGAAVMVLVNRSIAPGETVGWEGFTVLNPEDYVFMSLAASGMSAWASGAVLLGAPTFPPGRAAPGPTPRS
jgi:hypothetical protein